MLAEEALDRAGRPRDPLGLLDEEIADKVSLSLLDDEFVARAQWAWTSTVGPAQTSTTTHSAWRPSTRR
jgi:hypothetical protein